MNYYIIQLSDQNKDGKKITALEIFNHLVRDNNVWAFGQRTPNRKRIQKGDKVLFYVTGLDNQYFIGSATLESGAYQGGDISEILKTYDNPDAYRIDLSDVQLFSEPKYRKSIVNLEWQPNMGGSSKISEADYNLIIGSVAKVSATNFPTAEEQTEFVLEKYLEEFMVSNWSKLDFGEKLKLFEDEDGNIGQQYYAEGIGYIDILALDKDNNFVVIELKKGRKNDEVIGQVLRYIGWVRRNLAKNGQDVRGLVVVGEKDQKLEYALDEISSKVKVKRYSINFKLMDY